MSEEHGALAVEDLQIRLEPEWERRNWSRWLGCSEQQLQDEDANVGKDERPVDGCDSIEHRGKYGAGRGGFKR